MAKKKYDVGYKKPPQDTRFQPGQSGNPSGRPKGSKNKRSFHPLQGTTIYEMQKQIVDVGLEEIKVVQDGHAVSMTKMDAVMAQLYNKAMNGHTAAARLVLQYNHDSLESLGEGAVKMHEMTLKDREKEREWIFNPLPQDKDCGLQIYNLHKFMSKRFALREMFGNEFIPAGECPIDIIYRGEPISLNFMEPKTEDDWLLLNLRMRRAYQKYGRSETN